MKKIEMIVNAITEMSFAWSERPPQNRIRYYAEQLESYDLSVIERSIKKLTKKSNYFPSLGIILEEIRNNSKFSENKKSENCSVCDNIGLVSMRLKNPSSEVEAVRKFTFQCLCQNAAQSPIIPKWRPELKEIYTSVRHDVECNEMESVPSKEMMVWLGLKMPRD